MATINPIELRIIVGSDAEALIQLSYEQEKMEVSQ
jgi:hypothetical protein